MAAILCKLHCDKGVYMIYESLFTRCELHAGWFWKVLSPLQLLSGWAYLSGGANQLPAL